MGRRTNGGDRFYIIHCGCGLAVLLAPLKCAQEAGAESIVHPYQLRVRAGALFVARFARRGLAVLVRRAATRPAVGLGHATPPATRNPLDGIRPPYARRW